MKKCAYALNRSQSILNQLEQLKPRHNVELLSVLSLLFLISIGGCSDLDAALADFDKFYYGESMAVTDEPPALAPSTIGKFNPSSGSSQINPPDFNKP